MHGVMETFLIQVPSAGFPHEGAYRQVIEMSGEGARGSWLAGAPFIKVRSLLTAQAG